MTQSTPSDRTIDKLAQALLQFAATAELPDSITAQEIIRQTDQSVPTLVAVGHGALDRLNEKLASHQLTVGWSPATPARDGRFYLQSAAPRSEWPISINNLQMERLQREKSRVPCKIGTQPAVVWLLKNETPTVGQPVAFLRSEGGKWTEGLVTKINPDGHFFIDLI